MRGERGKRIQGIRKQLGLNQKEFGDKLGGLGTSTISGYENEDTEPKYDTLAQIAALGEVTLDWLITGHEPEKKTTNGTIAATIEPGNRETKSRLMEVGEEGDANHNVLLRQIFEWMATEFEENDEQTLFFYEDIRDRYPSFKDFMEKKRPGGSSLATSTQNEKLNSA